MSRRRKNHQGGAFESAGGYTVMGRHKPDTSANIYESMLRCKAWQSITDRQRVLYLLCKAQYYGKRKPSADLGADTVSDDACFYLPFSTVVDVYGMYGKSHFDRFKRDMDALRKAGLIDLVVSGKSTRTMNVYRLSAKWREVTEVRIIDDSKKINSALSNLERVHSIQSGESTPFLRRLYSIHSGESAKSGENVSTAR